MKVVLEMENHNKQEGDFGFGGSFVKVMTDEQLELLRHQISVFVLISEQLASMHKSFTSQQHHLSGLGMKFGSIGYDPLLAYSANKMSSRQRWSPTPAQLQMLERIFDEGNGTPTKHKIKDITSQLSQHGQISETNVYNWFQNRRARSKRKQSATAPQSSAEPEEKVETLTKQENSEIFEDQPLPAMSHDDHHDYFPSPEDYLSWSDNGSVYELQLALPSWTGLDIHEL